MKNLSRRFLYRSRSSGSILVIVMWILVFFSILGVGLYSLVSSQIKMVRYIENRIICAYLAKSALIYVLAERKKDITPYDTLAELRTVRERKLGIGSFAVALIDEESKININTAPVEVISKLPGLNLELAEGINSCKVRPFVVKEQVLLSEDITEELYNQFKEFITVYSENVNINTAPPEVLKALGLKEGVVEAIAAYRNGADGIIGTEDDGVFENTNEIIDKLRSALGFSSAQELNLLSVIGKGWMGVGSKKFSMNVETKVLNKPAMKYVIMVVDGKVKQWKEF